ncbi:uncharacterized protein [Diabrotica undecimpunctata]|uniref:uncharacterized protein n=1 Tax=Diabrotica undecimpunctata TaxID=50387 RepID=UPI003B63E9C8
MSKFSKYEMKRALTTKELMALLEEDSDCENADSLDVVYVPPETDEISDVEDIDDNIIGTEGIKTDIAGTYEIQVNENSDDSDDDIPLNHRSKRPKKEPDKNNKSKFVPSWVKTDTPSYSAVIQHQSDRYLENIKANHGGKSPIEVCSLLFDKEVIWSKIRKLKGTNSFRHINALTYNNEIITCKKAIGETLAEVYQENSSDQNITPEFLLHKQNIESFEIVDKESGDPLNATIALQELEYSIMVLILYTQCDCATGIVSKYLRILMQHLHEDGILGYAR